MTLVEVKQALQQIETVGFKLSNGSFVEPHFHVTEVGMVTKHFIDCGGTVRREERVNFQLWNANDYNHRLHPDKFLEIIALAEKTFALPNAEIEVEYQGTTTIEKYQLGFDGTHFLLLTQETACLAPDKCGIPEEQLPKQNNTQQCTPGSGCC